MLCVFCNRTHFTTGIIYNSKNKYVTTHFIYYTPNQFLFHYAYLTQLTLQVHGIFLKFDLHFVKFIYIFLFCAWTKRHLLLHQETSSQETLVLYSMSCYKNPNGDRLSNILNVFVFVMYLVLG